MLIIKKVHTGYIVARAEEGDDRHSHFTHKASCHLLISLIKKGLMPDSPYMREAARRVLNEDHFNKLRRPHKQPYVNKRRVK